MLYVFNTALVPFFDSPTRVNFHPLELHEARKFLREEEFVSAVGHQATADFLSDLLGVEIPMNRIRVSLKSGDKAIRLCLRQRLPEGKILTRKEMEELEYDLDLIVVL
jgi:hypothetical protein